MSETFSWVEIDSPDELEAFFLSVLPKIREAAKKCGYGIGVHGSLRRDLDLIATPWVSTYLSKDTLAEEIHKAACGLKNTTYTWLEKPNGRTCTTMPICWVNFKSETTKNGSGYIDLSVVGYRERSLANPSLIFSLLSEAERNELFTYAEDWMRNEMSVEPKLLDKIEGYDR